MRVLPAERSPRPPALALALWALLLLAVGYIEARDHLVRNQIERLTAEADLLRTGIETFLAAGLPLADFLGFAALSEATFRADPALSLIEVVDTEGGSVFATPRPSAGNDTWRQADLPAWAPRLPGESRWRPPAELLLSSDDEAFQVSLPLRNRFETVGRVVLSGPRDLAHAELRPAFAAAAALLALLTAAYPLLDRARRARGEPPAAGRLNRSAGWLGLLMAAAVLATLYHVFAESTRGKAEVLAVSLGERLGQSVDLGLDLDSFERIDQLFAEYQRSNPDVGFVTLVVGNVVTLHTDPEAERARWQPPPDSFTATVEVQPRRVFSSQVRVALGIERALVYRDMAYSAGRLAIAGLALAVVWLVVLNVTAGRRGDARIIAPV